MTERYNGWANYETWCVNLWLTNEQSSYNEFREMAQEFEKEQMYELGKAIKERVEDETGEILENFSSGSPYQGMISDVFRASLSLVDWEEIAKGFKEE